MKISRYLKKENCVMDLKACDKESAIREIAVALSDSGAGVIDKEKFVVDILQRESLGSTAIGYKLAIPHSRTEAVNNFVIAFGRSKEGVDFDSIDGEKANFIFLMGTNPQELSLYLRLLAQLSRLVIQKDFREELFKAARPEDVVALFRNFEHTISED